MSAAGCRSAAVRLVDQRDGAELQAARQLLVGGPVTGRLWVQDVPVAAGSPAAAGWRDRELGRPVDPTTGPADRSVLLRYPDGPVELVVVSHQPIESAAVRAPAPDWGFGDGSAGVPSCCSLGWPAPAGQLSEHRPSASEGGAERSDSTAVAELVAALGLVLSRYQDSDRVRIGLHPGRVLSVSAAPRRAVGDYLQAVRVALDGAATGEAGPAPVVGLAAWAPPVAVVEARPFLAPPYPLSFAVQESTVRLWYYPGEVSAEVVSAFVRQLVGARRQLAELGPDRRLAEVAVIDVAEQRTLAELGGLGRQPSAMTDHEQIHLAVTAHAAQRPEAVAVCAGDRRLTYRQLDRRADQVARSLRRRGVSAGMRVGVCLDRSAELVVILLGVLKAGAAYVPIDPAWPADRRAFVVADAGLALLVSTEPIGDVSTVSPEALAGTEPAAVSPVPITGDGTGTAYVIYTSGSTGLPKGVAVAHRNVSRLLAATAAEFGFGPHDVWTQFHSTAFDFSVWEIWGCLMTGGRLVVVPYRTSRMPEAFAALLAAEQVSVLNQTPSAFYQLLDVDRQAPLPASLRLVIFGGEPLDTGPLRSWFDRHPEPTCRLVNMYGITETTVHVTAQPLSRADALAGSRSVGRPLPGWHVYLRDRHGRPVPLGVPGEIYVGGVGVAGRYLNRPELTEARFLPDPWADGLLYRTGDRGRLNPDGRLDHLGRVDSQVQLRGHRVELGEVRARLLDTPGVRSAAVVLRHDPADPVADRLDAYVVGEAEPEQVRRHATDFLPDYMVPATVTRLPALPLTANGKVDETRLPAPGSGRPGPAADRPAPVPAGDDSVAGTVQAAWEQVFGFRVGPDDDFFSVGGNSLIAVRLLAALQSAGLPRLAVSQLYRNRTVNRLVAVLNENGTEVSA